MRSGGAPLSCRCQTCCSAWQRLPAKWAARFWGRPLVINRRRYAELASEGFVCRVDRLRERLGIVASIDLREGLAQTAEWYRRERWL